MGEWSFRGRGLMAPFGASIPFWARTADRAPDAGADPGCSCFTGEVDAVDEVGSSQVRSRIGILGIVQGIVGVDDAFVTSGGSQKSRRDHLADHKVSDLARSLDAFPTTGTGRVNRGEFARIGDLEPTTT